MSNYQRGKSDDLYHPTTGKWLGKVSQQGKEQIVSPDVPIPITGNTTLNADLHDGQMLDVQGAYTLTYPPGLGATFMCGVQSSTGSDVTTAKSGAATLNGSTSNVVRTFANNPAGFVIRALAADAGAVSGA